MVQGAPVLKNEGGQLTRLPVDTVVGSVEAYMEVSGLTEEQAIAATLRDFSEVPGGAGTLLAYQDARLKQPQPVR